MTWVKTDDSAPQHPKMIRAGAEACWLWQSGLCYSNKNKLNGKIAKDLLPALYIPLAAKASKLAKKLCDVGLWHDRGDHYEIHDYADYQEQALKEAQEARREYERDRKRAQRSGTNTPRNDNGCPANVPDNVPDTARDISTPVPSATRASPVPSRPVPGEERETAPPPAALRREPASGGAQTFEFAFGAEAFRREVKPAPTLSPGQVHRFAKRAQEHADDSGMSFEAAAKQLVSQAFDDAEATGKPVAITLADCVPGKPRGARASPAELEHERRNPTRHISTQTSFK